MLHKTHSHDTATITVADNKGISVPTNILH